MENYTDKSLSDTIRQHIKSNNYIIDNLNEKIEEKESEIDKLKSRKNQLEEYNQFLKSNEPDNTQSQLK